MISNASPTTVTHGVPATLQSTIKNIGSATANNFTSWFQILDSGFNCTSPYCGGEATESITLTVGATSSATASHTFPVVGWYIVRLCADLPGSVTESDETNNCGPAVNVYAN